MLQQFNITSGSYISSNNNIDNSTLERQQNQQLEKESSVTQFNQREIKCNLHQKFKSTQEFTDKLQISDETRKDNFFLQQHRKCKLFSFTQLESVLPQVDENKEEVTNLSKFLKEKLVLDESQQLHKEFFNSIEQIHLQPKIEPQKKSSPPPGFEQMFSPQDFQQQQQQYQQLSSQSLISTIASQPDDYLKYEVESFPGKVLYISGLDNPSLNLQSLYNIFSNFGLTMRMLFFRQKGSLLLQYNTSQQAMQCKEWMNGISLCGNVIRIFDSNHKEIKYKQQGQNIGDFWERDQSCKDRGKQVNPPSDVVHVANLRPEACFQNVIAQVFGMVGYVQNMKLLLEDPQKKMCLVKFCTVEESINAVAFLHGYWLFGRFDYKLNNFQIRSKI